MRLVDSTHSAFDPAPDPPAIVPPPQPVYDVKKYGAVGDGVTFDTSALQRAIDACAGSGGTVYLAGGKFLTAPLVLKAGMTFYIDKSAALLGSTRPADYPDLMPEQTAAQALRKSVLFADRADHLILDGGGEIDGQGQSLPMGGKEPLRPSLLRIFSSTDVTVRNLTLRNPRMWTQVYSECSGLTIDHVKVFAPHGYCPNLDGMDICDSDHVTISNCTVEAQDDGICLKSHGTRGLHDIAIRNNTITDFDANGIKLGTATHGPMERIRIENNVIKSARFGGVCIESVDGAHVSDITVHGLEMTHVCQPIYVRLSHRDPPPNDLQFSNTTRPPAGSIDRVLIENLRATQPDSKTSPSCTITGIPDARLGAIVIRNAYVEMPGGLATVPAAPPEHDGQYPQSNQFGQVPGYAFYVRHAGQVTFDHVTVEPIKPDVRPGLAADDAKISATSCTNLGVTP
jgi:polygalacturonase